MQSIPKSDKAKPKNIYLQNTNNRKVQGFLS